jgi:GAF domain-containing protein/HAMP domain-containing protein
MSMQVEKPRTSRSLVVTLAIAFLALSVTALLIASGFQIFLNIQTQQETVASRQQFIAQDAANTVASFIQGKFDVLSAAARFSDPTLTSQEEQARVLANLLGEEPAFRHLVLLDSQGQELAKSTRLSEAAAGNLVDRAGGVFAQTEQGKRYVSPVYVDEATSEPMIVIAVPVIDAFGDFHGALLAEVNLKFMWDLVDRLEVGEGGQAYVVDRYGRLIAFGDVSRVLRGENVKHLREVGEFVDSAALVDETGANISPGINGTTVVGTYVPLGTPDWAVVTELPVAEAYRAVIQSAVLSAGVILIMTVVAGLLGVYVARRLAAPLLALTETAVRVAGGEVGLQAKLEGPSETVDLAKAFNSMTAQLQELIGSLEQRVASRTRSLEASAQVARAAASILDVDQLTRGVVELIRERFGLYYVGLFLVDEAGEWAVLRAGTGEAGRAMLARGHRIRVGEGMVGWSVAHAQARVAEEVGADAVHLATAELPDTRSEAALALRSRGQVLGALTVQSDQPGVFDEQTIAGLQTMADQVAVAIDNARLFAESRGALEAERRAYGELSRQAWGELLRSRTSWGYRCAGRSAVPVVGDWPSEMRQAEQTGHVVQTSVDTETGDGARGSALSIPLQVRGEVIGVLGTYKPAEAGEWTDEELALLETLTDQLGEALEGARLYRETQRRAARERLTGHIVNRMRSAVDLGTLMQTTITEIAATLGSSSAFVQIGVGSEPSVGGGVSEQDDPGGAAEGGADDRDRGIGRGGGDGRRPGD